MLHELPRHESFHQADMIMQSAANLGLIQLLDCDSVKVKRHSSQFADRHRHAWHTPKANNSAYIRATGKTSKIYHAIVKSVIGAWRAGDRKTRPRQMCAVHHNPAVNRGISLTACQTETPMEWQLRKSFEHSSERACRDKKGTPLYSACYQRQIHNFNEFCDGVQARCLGVKKPKKL